MKTSTKSCIVMSAACGNQNKKKKNDQVIDLLLIETFSSS